MARPTEGSRIEDLRVAHPKVAALLERSLGPEESIDLWASGLYDQTVALTATRVFVAKSGIAAGAAFGGTANSYEYRQIVNVQMHTAMFGGVFELRAAGTAAAGRLSTSQASRLPNAVPIEKKHVQAFDRIAVEIRNRLSAAAQTRSTLGPSSGDDDIPNRIRQLAQLREQGLVSTEEYEAKRADLLSRF